MNNILITGINGGLGGALKESFLERNYKVYGHSTTPNHDIQAEFNNIESITKIKDFIFEKNITGIINNAGIYSNTEFYSLKEKDIQKIININLVAPIILSKYLLEYLTSSNKNGFIVNINSLAGKYPNYNESIYCASKHGLAGFSASISINKKNKINVIDCFPGALKTNMSKSRLDYNQLIEPKELAEKIAFAVEHRHTGVISSFEYRRK